MSEQDNNDVSKTEEFFKVSTTQPTNAGLQLLRQLPSKVADLLKQHFEQRLRINKAPRLSAGATTDQQAAAQQRMTQEQGALKDASLSSVRQFRIDASKHETAARSDVNRRLGRPEPADSAEANLRESREARAWARTKPLLDQVEPVALPDTVRDLAIEALASNDDDALSALRLELPAYTRLRSADRSLADQILAAVTATLDQAVAQARPAVAEVLQEQRELEVGMRRLLLGFTYAEHAINESELSAVIPSWDPKQPELIVKGEPVDHPA